jgi:hypothetical protein
MLQLNKITENVSAWVNSNNGVRWYDAVGEVQKVIVDNTYRSAEWTVTATGTSPITPSVVAGAAALITTAATEYAGDNIQFLGTQFKAAAGKPFYFGAKLTVSDATQSDLLVGLFGTDTTLTAASTAHAIDVGAGGIGFTKLDGSTQVYAKSFTTATENNSAAVLTLDTSAHIYEFYGDTAGINFYLDGVLTATFTTTITTEVLTPSINFRAGEAVAKTLTVHWLRAFQVL